MDSLLCLYAIALNDRKGFFAQRVTEFSINVFDLIKDERGQLFLFDSIKEAEQFIKDNQIKMELFETIARQKMNEVAA